MNSLSVWFMKRKARKLATKLEKALQPWCHVALTGSMLYDNARPGGGSYKDIDLLLYPDGNGEEVSLVVNQILDKEGLKFVRFGKVAEYGPCNRTYAVDNHRVGVYDYNGTRVDIIRTALPRDLSGLVKLERPGA